MSSDSGHGNLRNRRIPAGDPPALGSGPRHRVSDTGPRPPMNEVTRILSAIEQGDPKASEQLLPLVYDELRKLAAARLARMGPGQTLQATALVHEAYLRLVENGRAPPPTSPTRPISSPRSAWTSWRITRRSPVARRNATWATDSDHPSDFPTSFRWPGPSS
ncbi:MAG TPA: ECF-type sigma factor [Isosphaeraceae bacterium]|nr:ECF-type sigma factor [Isosphaeraceae bacterium]